MAPITSVLFDLDGTILDTADDLGAALNHVLGLYNLPTVTREQYQPEASNGALGLLKLGFGDALNNYDVAELRALFLNYYEENIATHTCLYSGMTETLTYLDNHNIPWGIVTNKPEYLTDKLVKQFPEFKACKIVISGDTLAVNKPDPLPLTFAADKMNIEPTQCLYIGDALRDIEAANSANMISVVAQWGYIDNIASTKSWQANLSFDSPNQIQLYINQSI